MKLSKKFIAVPAIAITAGLGLTACGGNGNSGPSLTAGHATVSQICQSQVSNQHLQNGDGTDSNTWIVSDTAIKTYTNSAQYQANQAVPVNSSGNEVVQCGFTLDTGANMSATVTLFANGSTGLTSNN